MRETIIVDTRFQRAELLLIANATFDGIVGGRAVDVVLLIVNAISAFPVLRVGGSAAIALQMHRQQTIVTFYHTRLICAAIAH